MTKKDYEILAKLIKESDASSNGWMHKPSFVIRLASYLQRDNPRFNLQRFVKACGITEPISLEEAQRPVNRWWGLSEPLKPSDLKGIPIVGQNGLSPITFGDLFTLEEFEQLCRDGSFIDNDGHGKYSDGKLVSNIRIIPSDVTHGKVLMGWTHVVWYNK